MQNSIQILEPSRQTLFLEDKKTLGKDHLYGIVEMLTKRRFALLNLAKMSHGIQMGLFYHLPLAQETQESWATPFVSDCPRGIWDHGLTTCPLYVWQIHSI